MKKNSDNSKIKFCLFVFYSVIFLSALPLICSFTILCMILSDNLPEAHWGTYIFLMITIFLPIININFLLEPVKLLINKLKNEDFQFSRDEIITVAQINIPLLLSTLIISIFAFICYNIGVNLHGEF